MKRWMLPVILAVVFLAAGCGINDALTKAREKYDAVVLKIRAAVGDENIVIVLNQYDDEQAAESILAQYEIVSKETLSDENKALLKLPLIMALRKLRADLTE